MVTPETCAVYLSSGTLSHRRCKGQAPLQALFSTAVTLYPSICASEIDYLRSQP
jgi:hypothetical protein